MNEGHLSSFHRMLTASVLMCLVSVAWSPVALADTAWKEDGWLTTTLAQDRLDLGDEFGCYGMLGLSWQTDPGAVALECRAYIEDRVSASMWGDTPISTYTPDGLTMSQHTTIAGQGFVIHGDETGLSTTAWHNATDEPTDKWDWYNLGRRGGSMEQLIGSVEEVQAAVEEGGLVNLYWIGRVNDATIRHDRDISAYLEQAPDVWLTTWGQAWSYWTVGECYEFSHSVRTEGEQSILTFESLITEECTGMNPEAWNVPITWRIDLNGAAVASVTDDTGSLEDITGARKSAEGYAQADGEYLHLSLVNGHAVEVRYNGTDDYDIMGRSSFFNNHSTAVTIAAHETHDLFKWSKRFVDDEHLVFTWLVEPREGLGESSWLRYAAVAVGIGTVVAMMFVLKREGLGPLAKRKE
ncbi:MAG: hypothetical protein MG2_0930 [uncultured Candidatus Poseidoniales archaeon]|jgi:hypothetical protein|nr:MAG: hypothetical protein MG2_0930 [uncultured Candidatus Poseidoniales archaeon]MBT5618308.1 hypothetical protein [Euryarchaeota archaeon]